MTNDDKIRDEKIQYDIRRAEKQKRREAASSNQKKYQHYHPEKLINMNILQVKKYWHLIKVE